MATTDNRNYPLPDPDHNVSDDVGLLIQALEMVDGDVDALLAALSGKAATVHTHAIGDVDGLQQALDGKAAFNHTHKLDDLTDVDGTAAAVTGSILVKVAAGWSAGNPAEILGNHEHIISDVQGLQAALDGKLDTSSLPAAISGVTSKSTPVDADTVPLTDSAASGALKKVTWSNIKTTLKTYFDTIYSLAGHVHASATTSAAGFMSAADKSKLDGIEAGADVTPGAATTSAAGLMSAADKSKLNGIAAGAQVNPTALAIKTAYESNSNTNAYTDAEKTKLSGVATGATANSTDASLRARSTHTGTQDISSTTTGTLPVSRGGTGATSAASALSALGGAGFYTGSTAGNTSYPDGSIVAANTPTGVAPNTAHSVYYSASLGTFSYFSTDAVLLSGTWRSRSGSGNGWALWQRTA